MAGQVYPLEGIRVIDITVVWAGPYGTMFLADMGAEVIRVESINIFPSSSRGQFARPSKEAEARRDYGASVYPNRDPGERPWNRPATFNAHARNKYSMTANLTTPEGKDVFRRLVEVSDVFVENNAVGSMERLGFTYPVLSQWNPRLIAISATGQGRTGPWAHYRGYGSQSEALMGHSSVMGYPDMDPSGAPGSVATDATTGVTIALATVMALHQREKTGKGIFIDLSMSETFIPHLGEHFMDYFINQRVAGALGNRDPNLVQGCYRCLGEDEWIAITIGADDHWQALCQAMEQPEMAKDPRFATMSARQERHDEIDQIIEAWTSQHAPYDLFHKLQNEGVPSGPVMHEDQVHSDPHVRAREFLVPITHPEIGTHDYPSTVFKASKLPFKVRKPPVRLGEDNDYVYREVLKLTEAEYDHLKTLGQIGMDYDPSIR